MSELESFLSTVPVFRSLTPEELRDIAPLCQTAHYPAGTVVLRQGGYSEALYFLRSGQCAVNVHRGDHSELVARLDPPTVFGELSFITGRQCSADVEVLVDADVVLLPKEAVPQLKYREHLLRGMMTVLAERLHDTVTRGGKVKASPVVLLKNGAQWEAPHAFAAELGRSLARQSKHETLVVALGLESTPDMRDIGDGAYLCEFGGDPAEAQFRTDFASRLTGWKQRFNNVILNPAGAQAGPIAATVEAFADTIGHLGGAGDMVPQTAGANQFVVESALAPTLSELDGRRQLIWDAEAAESAWRSGEPVPARFRRTADSIARAILGIQVGLALGGGAAWGWAHIGVLSVLEEAGLPIDVLAGCSMGSVIGSLRSTGSDVAAMTEIAHYWQNRTRRFVEWRFWKMCLLNENIVRKVFQQYFGDRNVNQTEIPYWANAVDIRTGHEYTVRNGTLVHAVRASIALPGLMPPFRIGEHLLVDAGIMDPVPVNLVRRMGCHYTIAVNAMAALESQDVNPRYPFNAFDIMIRCTRVMGHEIGQARAEDAADMVLTPKLGQITMLQFTRSPEIIECGRRVAEENLPAILAGYERLKTRQLAEVRQTAAVEQKL